MRCPKCRYISFESGTRCRNCGYDFSLTEDVQTPDLLIQDGNEPIGPMADLSLRRSVPAEEASEETNARVAAPRPITSSFDLPLFRNRKSDEPLLPPAAPPRAPLAVRRGAAAIPKPRPRRNASDPFEEAEPRLALEGRDRSRVPETKDSGQRDDVIRAARIIPRMIGGLIDFLIVAGIDFSVLYFTLKICNLTFAEATALPAIPFIAFVALLNGGYFTIFVAAGGQTIGKMTAGIRVVPADPAARTFERVSFRQALLRAAAYLVSALPLGLGFLPGLIGPERRALHDRLADTRVIQA
jgi:uncharacterized RDD family membrane protein YckC